MSPKSALLPLLAALPYASAWGSLGHTTVAYIAQNYVSHKTAKFAQRLFNDTSSAYLANVATWADSYRYEAGGQFSSVYHYIDALDNPVRRPEQISCEQYVLIGNSPSHATSTMRGIVQRRVASSPPLPTTLPERSKSLSVSLSSKKH